MVEISVIIPVYNAEKYLSESINSILNQTFTDIEVICVDDGSQDNSLNMLYEFEKKDNRIQVFHQENNGGGAARNFALPKAKGKYIYFMDADDIIELDAFEQFYNLAEEKNVDFIICRAINYNSDTDEYYKEEYFYMDTLYDFVGDEVFDWRDIGELVFKISVTPWGKFFNREFVIKSGARFAEGLIFHDNIFFWEMLFNSNRIYFYDKELCYRRVHSKSSVESRDKRFVSTIPIHNMIVSIFIKYNQFEKFKKRLYTKKLYLVNDRYMQVKREYRDFFLAEMKKDFSKMCNHELYDEFIEIISLRNRAIFENALKSDTPREYELAIENFELNAKVQRLERDKENLQKDKQKLIVHRDELIAHKDRLVAHKDELVEIKDNLRKQKKQLKKEKKKLKKDNKKLKEENDSLKHEIDMMKNTVSWKMTKPIRVVRGRLK